MRSARGFSVPFSLGIPGLALCAPGTTETLKASWMNLHSGCQCLLKVCLEFFSCFRISKEIVQPNTWLVNSLRRT